MGVRIRLRWCDQDHGPVVTTMRRAPVRSQARKREADAQSIVGRLRSCGLSWGNRYLAGKACAATRERDLDFPADAVRAKLTGNLAESGGRRTADGQQDVARDNASLGRWTAAADVHDHQADTLRTLGPECFGKRDRAKRYAEPTSFDAAFFEKHSRHPIYGRGRNDQTLPASSTGGNPEYRSIRGENGAAFVSGPQT